MSKPSFSSKEFLDVAKFGFGFDPAEVEPLPSYDDLNALVKLADGSKIVVKLAASGADCRGCVNVALLLYFVMSFWSFYG